MANPLVRATFALLVLATIAAFFVTQQLKGEFPLVLRFAATPNSISPTGDGVRDDTIVGFDLSEPAKVSFSVVDSEGEEVRTLVDDRELKGDVKYRYTWNGRDDEGRRVPDGRYTLRVVRRDEGRVINSIKTVRVDTERPRVRLVSARPGVISPGDRRASVRIRYRGPRNEAPEFRIFRTDEGPPRVVARFRGNDKREAVWHGGVRGRPAVDGDYTFTVTVRDKAGNLSVAPAEIPTARTARAGTGVAVRHLTLQGPVTAVRAGSLARLEAGPYRRRFRFSLARVGSRRPLRRGTRRGGAFRVRVPARSRTGLYLVAVRAGGRRAVWPLAVQGRSRGRAPRPLVVVPVITWQGLNRWDDDADGFADTLRSSRSVALRRPYAKGRAPAALRSETEPLLRFLDRARLPYDLATDVAPPSLRERPGVVLAGGARWLPPELLDRLRSYVRGGGRVASFGADALRRSVGLRRDLLRNPTAAGRENALGERTALFRAGPAPLSVQEDDLRVFGGDRFLGEFSVFERSAGLGRQTRRLAAAGRDPEQAAFVAYRLRRGLVVRVGTPQWSAQLAERPELQDATGRVWSLLER